MLPLSASSVVFIGCLFRWKWLTSASLLQMGDILIPSLMVGDCSRTLCLRVSRLWEFLDPQDDSRLLHTDLVLLDEEVDPSLYWSNTCACIVTTSSANMLYNVLAVLLYSALCNSCVLLKMVPPFVRETAYMPRSILRYANSSVRCLMRERYTTWSIS